MRYINVSKRDQKCIQSFMQRIVIRDQTKRQLGIISGECALSHVIFYKRVFGQLKHSITPQPPYTLDTTSNGVFLFPRFKNYIKGVILGHSKDPKSCVMSQGSHFKEEIFKLQFCLNKKVLNN